MPEHIPPQWIPDNQKSGVSERLEPVKKAEGHKGRCRFVIDEKGRQCKTPVHNNCHVIPEKAVLGQLKDNASGKVLELRWRVSKWDHFFVSSSETNPIDLNTADAFEPQSVGTGDACVRWFVCEDHDKKFEPVDVGEPDFSDPTVRFLCAYRAALYAADLSRLGKRLLQEWDERILRNASKLLRVQWIKEKGALKTGIPSAQSIATRLGKIWCVWNAHTEEEFDPNVVSGQLLPFRSRLKYAACVSYGQGLCVMVFPVGEDRHKMGILHLAEGSGLVNEDKERLTEWCNASESSDNYGVNVLQRVMENGSGTVAASPESYQGLSEEQKQAIRQVVRSHSAADQMVKAFPPPRPWPQGRSRKRRKR